MKYKCFRQLSLLQEEVVIHLRVRALENRVRVLVCFDYLDVLREDTTSRKDVFGIMGWLDKGKMESRSPPHYFQHSSAPSQYVCSQVKGQYTLACLSPEKLSFLLIVLKTRSELVH